MSVALCRPSLHFLDGFKPLILHSFFDKQGVDRNGDVFMVGKMLRGAFEC